MQDPTLLRLVPLFTGISTAGFVLVNGSGPFADLQVDDLVPGLDQRHLTDAE